MPVQVGGTDARALLGNSECESVSGQTRAPKWKWGHGMRDGKGSRRLERERQSPAGWTPQSLQEGPRHPGRPRPPGPSARGPETPPWGRATGNTGGEERIDRPDSRHSKINTQRNREAGTYYIRHGEISIKRCILIKHLSGFDFTDVKKKNAGNLEISWTPSNCFYKPHLGFSQHC